MTERDEVVEWKKGRRKAEVEKYVSIYAHGRIGFPKAVLSEVLDSPEAVTLKFSKKTKEIGITPADPDDPDSYMINQDNRYITCTAFLEAFDLLTDESVRHPISDSNGTVWVDTTKTVN